MSLYNFLSNHDIINALDNKIKVVVYSDLINYDTIDQLLHPFGRVVLLYEQERNIGHWVCIHKQDNTLIYFDSYGLRPDDPQSWIGEKKRKELYDNMRYLSILLKKSPYNIEYNEYELQAPLVRTCGKWVCCRLSLPKLSTDQFAAVFAGEGDITPDMLADIYYNKYLKKT
jgi:hypothetical protein